MRQHCITLFTKGSDGDHNILSQLTVLIHVVSVVVVVCTWFTTLVWIPYPIRQYFSSCLDHILELMEKRRGCLGPFGVFRVLGERILASCIDRFW